MSTSPHTPKTPRIQLVSSSNLPDGDSISNLPLLNEKSTDSIFQPDKRIMAHCSQTENSAAVSSQWKCWWVQNEMLRCNAMWCDMNEAGVSQPLQVVMSNWAPSCFKGNAGETSDRQGGAHMGFSKRIDNILNWTERTSIFKTPVCGDW